MSEGKYKIFVDGQFIGTCDDIGQGIAEGRMFAGRKGGDRKMGSSFIEIKNKDYIRVGSATQ